MSSPSSVFDPAAGRRYSNNNEEPPLLSQELKKLRLRISDYNRSPVLEAIAHKIWKLMLVVQYEEVLLALVPLPSKLPLSLDCYQALIPLF